MVVDVLEEKMEQEYRVGALSLLKHINHSQLPSRRHDDDDGGGGDAYGSIASNSVVS